MPDDPELRADCSRCAALCCIVLPFDRSGGRVGFAFAKAAGEPCRHLLASNGCGIHADLGPAGMGGCVAYDCLGAGQHVVARLGADAPRDLLGRELLRVERLHELLVLLDQARVLADGTTLVQVEALRSRVAAARDTDADPDVLAGQTGALLEQVSRAVRGHGAVSRRHADLAGADLREVDLTGADLRGAVLIGADLRGARLARTDLLGADLRDTDLRGVDLSTAFFWTGPQVARARRS